MWAEVVKLHLRCTFSQVAASLKSFKGSSQAGRGVNTPTCSIMGADGSQPLVSFSTLTLCSLFTFHADKNTNQSPILGGLSLFSFPLDNWIPRHGVICGHFVRFSVRSLWNLRRFHALMAASVSWNAKCLIGCTSTLCFGTSEFSSHCLRKDLTQINFKFHVFL